MKDSLDAILKKTTPTPTPEPDDDEGCGPCAAIAKNKWVTALTLKHANKPWESFQYKGLGVLSTFEPTRFIVRFFDLDDKEWVVTVHGRNLQRIYMLVIQARMEWLRADDRDFAADGVPIILSLTAEPAGKRQS